jgi:hypothetical protein
MAASVTDGINSLIYQFAPKSPLRVATQETVRQLEQTQVQADGIGRRTVENALRTRGELAGNLGRNLDTFA